MRRVTLPAVDTMSWQVRSWRHLRQAASALPVFLLPVVGLSFLLLTIAFRSLLVPLKATLGFLLSVGATFGALVAVFQWGWLSAPLGIDGTGPIISFLPPWTTRSSS